MALDLKPVNGRLELTSVDVRLGKISEALSNDEAVNFSQFTELSDRVLAIETGSDDLDRIELTDSGTVTAPAITWNGDTDTGIYRIGANNVGITCNGVQILNVATTGVFVTGVFSVTDTLSAGTTIYTGNGSAGVPSVTFSTDTDSGLYRIGANNIGISVGATKIIDVATTGASITGALSATTTVSAGTLLLTGDGAVGAPSHSFTSDTDTGMYRIGANNIGIAVGGTKVIDVAGSGVTITGAITGTTVAYIGDGAVGLPAWTFTNDTDCGLYRIGANNIGFSAAGAKVLDISGSGLAVTGALSATTTVTATTLVFSGDGAVGAPTYSFVSDTDTGIYRIGANNIGVACNGANVLNIATTGLSVTGVSNSTSTQSATGHLYTGSLTTSGAGTPQTLNTYAGSVTMTGIGSIASDASANVVINNSLVTVNTVGLVMIQYTTAAAGSTPRIENVAYAAGTITITIRNSDPATATGACDYRFSFILFQL